MAQNLGISMQDVQKLCFASGGQSIRFVVGKNSKTGNSTEIVCLVVDNNPQTVFPNQTINITPLSETRQCNCHLKTRESSDSKEDNDIIEILRHDSTNVQSTSSSIKSEIKSEIELDEENCISTAHDAINYLEQLEKIQDRREDVSKRISFVKKSNSGTNYTLELETSESGSDLNNSKTLIVKNPIRNNRQFFPQSRESTESSSSAVKQDQKYTKKKTVPNIIQMEVKRKLPDNFKYISDLQEVKKCKNSDGPCDIITKDDGKLEIFTLLSCRKARIGSYQFGPVEAVLSKKGFQINVPNLKDNKVTVKVSVDFQEIESIQAHFGKLVPVLIFYTTGATGMKIRNALEMYDPMGAFFNPASKADRHKRIIFFTEGFDAELREKIKSLFCCKLKEISRMEAYSILEKCTPKKT